jgi:hypothetical protein
MGRFVLRAWHLFAAATALAIPPPDPVLVQLHRPPEQTPNEKTVRDANVASAAAQSDAAKASLTAGLACTATLCKGKTAAELYEMFQYEFPRLPIIHNAPLNKASQIGDDTDLWTTIHNQYLQNVIQRYVLDEESQANMVNEGYIMVHYLGYTDFKNINFPTLRESNDRMIYLANNWAKKDCGNFQYGTVTYVINPIYSDKFFVAPCDTGAHHPDRAGWPAGNPKVALGTMADFDHVAVQHLKIYNYKLEGAFNDWYTPNGGAPNPACQGKSYCYFEIEWSGSAWLPESLLYIIAKAGDTGVGKGLGLFGTAEGAALQTWMQKSARPLVWADGDHSGILLDPVVDWYGYNGQKYIVDADRTFWNSAWKAKTVFATLYSSATSHLKMEYRSYFTKDICDNDEKDPGKMIMGVLTTDKLCVFWAWTGGSPTDPILNQQWVGPSSDTANTILFRHSCNNNVCSKCLDLSNNGDTTNGNAIDIYDCTGGQPQQWQYDTSTSQIQYLANPKKCLDIPGGDMRNGVTLQIWDCNDETSQQWIGAGAFQYQSKKDSTKCIDLFGADTTNGKRIEIWDCVAPPPPPPTPPTPATPTPPPSPHFSQQWLGPNSDTGDTILFKDACAGDPLVCSKCLDLSNDGNTTNGNPIDIWDCDSGIPQQWQFNTSDGTIRYKNDTKKCIDVPGGDFTNGNSEWAVVPILPIPAEACSYC